MIGNSIFPVYHPCTLLTDEPNFFVDSGVEWAILFDHYYGKELARVESKYVQFEQITDELRVNDNNELDPLKVVELAVYAPHPDNPDQTELAWLGGSHLRQKEGKFEWIELPRLSQLIIQMKDNVDNGKLAELNPDQQVPLTRLLGESGYLERIQLATELYVAEKGAWPEPIPKEDGAIVDYNSQLSDSGTHPAGSVPDHATLGFAPPA